MTRSDVAERLRELGIEHDGRLSYAKLVALLPEDERPEPEPETGPTIRCVILRDFWDARGDRHRKGGLIDATLEQALDGIETGALSRYKGE